VSASACSWPENLPAPSWMLPVASIVWLERSAANRQEPSMRLPYSAITGGDDRSRTTVRQEVDQGGRRALDRLAYLVLGG
jgi:hypothetical protein